MIGKDIWVEKYRPTELDDFILEEHVYNKIKQFIKKKEIPNLLLFGTAGTGKTSIMKYLMSKLPVEYIYINASEKTSIDVVREEIVTYIMTKSFDSEYKVVIIDECDGLSTQAQASLKVITEENYTKVKFIFGSNNFGKIIPPLVSRCEAFEIKLPSMEKIVDRCKFILNSENVEFNEDDLNKIIKANNLDMRLIINSLSKHTINNKLQLPKSYLLDANYKSIIIRLLKALDRPVDDRIEKMKKLINSIGHIEYGGLYDYLFDTVFEYATNKSKVGDILMTIEEYSYHHVFVVNKMNTFIACCVKIITINR